MSNEMKANMWSYGVGSNYDFKDLRRRTWDEFRECSYTEFAKAKEMIANRIEEIVDWRDSELIPEEPGEEDQVAYKNWRR